MSQLTPPANPTKYAPIVVKIVETEHTENPNEVRIRLSQSFPPREVQSFGSPTDAEDHPMARSLFLIVGVETITLRDDYVLITKKPEAIWPMIVPPAIAIIDSKARQMDWETVPVVRLS